MQDLISRQAAIDAVKNYCSLIPSYMEYFALKFQEAIKEDIIDDIKSLPSAQPEPYKGEE